MKYFKKTGILSMGICLSFLISACTNSNKSDVTSNTIINSTEDTNVATNTTTTAEEIPVTTENTTISPPEETPATTSITNISSVSTTIEEKYEIDQSIVATMDSYIDNLMSSTTSYVPSWNQESFKGRWNYIDGVFLNSLVNLYINTNDSKYMDFVYNYVNYYLDSDGNFININDESSSGYRSGELDSVCESKILFDLYNYKNEDRYKIGIDYTYNELTSINRCANNLNFSHKNSYLYQIWLDGMYMYVPFYSRYAKENNKTDIFNEITNQYKYIRDNMYDNNTGLYYHGNDTSKQIYWCNSETGNSSSFWLRSMGWYITSLADSIEYFPDGNNKDYLISLLNEALTNILKYQDSESKMFYQLIDQENKSFTVAKKYLSGLGNKAYQVNGSYVDATISNYLESSGSSMIAYSLMKSARLGYIDKLYFNVGADIFSGTYKHSFRDNKLNDICISAGLGPSSNEIRDGSYAYYLAEKVGSNDAKGVGPFIMAYIEYKSN